jgi:hypothetical protein
LRIIYSFHKKSGLWIVTCPSDKSVKESTHSSFIEAINYFFTSRDSIEYFDIVIPLSIPTPLLISRHIRKIQPQAVQPISKPVTIVFNSWGNKPIPPATIEFRKGMLWVMAIPPYDKQNVYYFRNPLPGTQKFASGKGSSYKTLQIFGGTLTSDINIDLGWDKVHIFPDGQDLKMEFIGAKDAALERWRQVEIARKKDRSIFSRFKRLLGF